MLVVLFVGGNGGPTAGADAAVMAQLESTFGAADVAYKQGSVATAADGTSGEFDLIVISSTLTSSAARNSFEDATAGVLNWEEALMKTATGDFQMVTSTTFPEGQTQLNIVNNSHPITAGFSVAAVDFASPGVQTAVSVGTLGDGVQVLATSAGNADQSALFVAETGVALLGSGADGSPATAAGRRVMFPMRDSSFSGLADEGRRLFDRAAIWAAGSFLDYGDALLQHQAGRIRSCWLSRSVSSTRPICTTLI